MSVRSLRFIGFDELVPWAGVTAGVLYAAKFALSGMPSGGSSADALTVVKAHQAQNAIVLLATALAAILVVVLSTGLRAVLRSGESEESSYSSVAYAGGILLAAFMLLRAWTMLAALSATGTGAHATVASISELSADLWLPWMAGTCLLLVGTGIGGLRSGVLPRRLCLVTVVLGVLSILGPGGFVVDFAMPVWLVATGLVLRRQRVTSAIGLTVS